MSQMASRCSLVTRRASSTTDSGRARLFDESVEEEPLAFAVESPLVAAGLPFVLGLRAESWRTSSRTRRRSAGKVVTSPERRRARAWDWMVVGQLAESELRAWRRASWILGVESVLARCLSAWRGQCEEKSNILGNVSVVEEDRVDLRTQIRVQGRGGVVGCA